MSTRDLILRVMPAGARRRAELESRSWMIRCRTCGHEASVWDAGGLRYKARSSKKVMVMRCSRCGRKRTCDVYRAPGNPGSGE